MILRHKEGSSVGIRFANLRPEVAVGGKSSVEETIQPEEVRILISARVPDVGTRSFAKGACSGVFRSEAQGGMITIWIVTQ